MSKLFTETSFRGGVGYWAKHILGGMHVLSKPLKKPILIISSRRGGSTLLMELIHSQQGMNYIDQPLCLWHYHPYKSELPLPYLGRFANIGSPQDEKKLLNFFSGIFFGETRVFSQWNWFRPEYSFVVNRIVVKELDSHALIEWYAANFDVDIVFMCRHPIPQSLSIMSRGWGCTGEAFLSNGAFLEKLCLEGVNLEKCKEIMARGSLLQKMVLEWCFENVIPLRLIGDSPWLSFTYEEMIARPEKVTCMLAQRLSLPDPELMASKISSPSKNALSASREMISRKGPRSILGRWMKELSAGEAREAMMPLHEIFELHAYSFDSPFPNEKLCHFGSLQDQE